MSKHSKKNALQTQRDNQAGVDKARAQGQEGGFSRAESSTGLTSSAQKAEEDLLRKAGPSFDTMETGGFAKRDQVRQAVNEDVQQLKRQKRVYNSAYRKAMRDGKPARAIDILNSAKANKVNFGGIQAAGRDREQVLQRKGEDLLTAVARDGNGGTVAEVAPQLPPAGDTGEAPPESDFQNLLRGSKPLTPEVTPPEGVDTAETPPELPAQPISKEVDVLSTLKKGFDEKVEGGKKTLTGKNPTPPANAVTGGFFDVDQTDVTTTAAVKAAEAAFDGLFAKRKLTT
jgi:hypothetical protein